MEFITAFQVTRTGSILHRGTVFPPAASADSPGVYPREPEQALSSLPGQAFRNIEA
jgi:hypothetical protein